MSEEFNINFDEPNKVISDSEKEELEEILNQVYAEENFKLAVDTQDENVIKKLEEGYVPFFDEEGKEISYVLNPSVAEDILLLRHERLKKEPLPCEDAMTMDEQVNKFLNHVQDNYDGELKKRVLKYAKLVNYHPELIYPILQNDIRFSSRLEEMDSLSFANMVLQADMFAKINDTLTELLVAVNTLTEVIKTK